MNDIDLDALARGLEFLSKSEQREAVGLFPKRRDVFAVLPTGFCKSLIFQLFVLAKSSTSNSPKAA